MTLASRSAIAVAFAVLVSSCGGGNGSTGAAAVGRPPDVWARDTCIAFQTWTDGFAAHIEQVQNDIPHARDFDDVRNLFVVAMNDLIVLTDEAHEALQAAGEPAVEHGEQFSAAFSDLLAEAREALVDVRDGARHAQSSQEVVDLARNRVGAFFGSLEGPLFAEAPAELRSAIANEPACKVLSGYTNQG